MAQFTYRAVNAAGRIVTGRADALNLSDLEIRLKRVELDFIQGKPVDGRALFNATVPRRELYRFFDCLGRLTQIGVSVPDALTDVRDSVENARFREIMIDLIASIERGQTLSESMGKYPRVFDRVFTCLVGAGEATGRLPEIMRRICEALEWEDELCSLANRLFLYPLMLGIAFAGVFLALCFASSWSANASNAAIKALSWIWRYFSAHWRVILSALFALSLALNILLTRNARLDSLKLKMPFFGSVLRNMTLSRVTSVFATLYVSGVPMVEAVRMAADLTRQGEIRRRLIHIERMMVGGKNVIAVLRDAGLFSPVIIRMLRVGEQSGLLDEALVSASHFHKRDVRECVENARRRAGRALAYFLAAAFFCFAAFIAGTGAA